MVQSCRAVHLDVTDVGVLDHKAACLAIQGDLSEHRGVLDRHVLPCQLEVACTVNDDWPGLGLAITGPAGAESIAWMNAAAVTVPLNPTTLPDPPPTELVDEQPEVEATTCACGEWLPAASYGRHRERVRATAGQTRLRVARRRRRSDLRAVAVDVVPSDADVVGGGRPRRATGSSASRSKRRGRSASRAAGCRSTRSSKPSRRPAATGCRRRRRRRRRAYSSSRT